MNKGSKLKSGWLAILNNEKQLLENIGGKMDPCTQAHRVHGSETQIPTLDSPP